MQVRQNIDEDETYRYLGGGDTQPGWKWDTTRKRMRCKSSGFGWSWDWTLVDLSCTPREPTDGDMWYGWRWYKYIEILIQVKHDLRGVETHILKPVRVCDVGWMDLRCSFADLVWMELRCYSVDLVGGETSPRWRWNTNIRTGPEFSWDTTQMERRHKSMSLAEGEIQILRFGWGWDGIWIELRQPYWDLNKL